MFMSLSMLEQLLGRDAELRCQIVHSRLDHSMPPSGACGRQLHHAAGQRAVPYAYRHDRRLSQLRADRGGAGPGQDGTPFADASRTTLSTARGLASSATTTHQHFPACSSLRTASTPTTTRRPR